MFDIPHFDHFKVDGCILALEHFLLEAERSDISERLAPLAEHYHSGHYRLVMVGEEKRGKSSLAAALLGEPGLLPSGPEPMTAAVFKLIYGPEIKYRVFFLPDDPDSPNSSRPDPIEVSAEEIAAYGTETGNPENVRRIDFIEVEHPHPLLKAGVTIVDLPGLGGLKREHGVLTLRYLAHADAAFFVVDSISGALNREEIATLERLRGFTDHIVFVQTKIDAVSSAQWQGWREQNLAEIEKRLGIPPADIHYFAVSNALKQAHDLSGDQEDLSDSGFPALLTMLKEDLLPAKQDLLAAPLLAAIAQLAAEAAQPIANEIAILETESQDDLDRLESALSSALADHESWKRDAHPAIIGRFRDDFRIAEVDADRAIARDLDASEHGPIVGPILAQLEADDEKSANDLIATSAMWNDRAVDECGVRLDHVSWLFDENTQTAFERAAGQISMGVAALRIAGSNYRVDLPFERLALKAHSTIWSTLLQGRLGLMAGTMVAGGVASMIFPPLSLAVAAISLLGGLFGAERSIRDGQQRERIQAENRLRLLLIDTVRRLQQHGTREFRIATEARRKAMLDALHVTLRQRDHDEQAAAEAIRTRRMHSGQQDAERITLLTQRLALADAIIDRLGEVGMPVGCRPSTV